MTLRRLAETQPEGFAFTPDNIAWAKTEIAKYPEGRQASAVIALLWRAQEQEGWVTEPAIRTVAEMLSMPPIRVLEVATFHTMFHLAPVGTTAHVQVCGTTPCWLRGANDLKDVCRQRIHRNAHGVSDDGKFSWEEVECLGACVNAPMVQIGADTYEDLTAERFAQILDALAAGKPVKSGPQVDRQFSAPVGGPTTLTETANGKRPATPAADAKRETKSDGATEKPTNKIAAPATGADDAPLRVLATPRDGKADDLKRIKGIGPRIEKLLNELGVHHYDQIAEWAENETTWVEDRLSFKGRIAREKWIAQAKALAGRN